MVVLTENSSQRDELDKGIPSHGGSGGMGQRLGRGQWRHEAGPATIGGSGGMGRRLGRGPVVGPGAGGPQVVARGHGQGGSRQAVTRGNCRCRGCCAVGR